MLILLDIDGVMVQAKSWSPPPALEDGFSVFTTQAVSALNAIIEASNADILLTTSHKGRFSISEWESIFSIRGVKVNSIQRLSSDSAEINRMEEISNWYSSNKNVDDFVIIDDDKSLNGLPNYLKSRLVLTQPLIGLTSGHINKVVRILNSPLELV